MTEQNKSINPHEDKYLGLMQEIMEKGIEHEDRTGKGRRSIFGTVTRYDISDGTIPLCTTRKIFTRGLFEELLWFIRGSYDVRELQDKKVKIWDPWTVSESDIEAFAAKHSNGDTDLHKVIVDTYTKSKLGTVGQMYGATWRDAPQHGPVLDIWPKMEIEDLPSDKLDSYQKQYDELKFISRDQESVPEFTDFASDKYYETIDQLNNLVVALKKRPHSSRHVVSAWIPSHVPFETIGPQENVLMEKGALAACHAFFQCFVNPPREPGGKKRLSLMMTIRSNDFQIGAPYNITQYCVLLRMLAQVCDMQAYEYIHSVGDCHIYLPHYEGAMEQLSREPYPAPTLWINPEVKDLFAFKIEDFEIKNYQHHPEIKYEIAV